MVALVGSVAVAALAGRPVGRPLLVGTMLVVLLSAGRHVTLLLETAAASRRLVSRTGELEREAGAILLDADQALELLETLGQPSAERALDALAMRSMLLEQRARALTDDARRLAQQPPGDRSG
jgi:hypothetical protein